MLKVKKAWLTNPWLIFSSIILGLIIGINNKALADQLSPIGRLYLALLGMCIVPIMITAIVSSLGKLLRTGIEGYLIRRLVISLILGLVMASLVGIAACLISTPGLELSLTDKSVISEHIGEQADNIAGTSQDRPFLSFLYRVIPGNIFSALSQGNNLAVLFFSILLGIALGKLVTKGADETLTIIHVMYSAFLKIVDWVMAGLPLGLCFLFTGYASQIQINEVFALGKLLLVIYGSVLILSLLCSLVIWRKSGLSYLKSLSAVKTPLLIAFGTCSSFAAIPAMIKSLEENLRIERKFVELLIPLGVTLFRQGAVLRLTVLAIFVAQLYHQDLTVGQLGVVLFASILAGLSASGVPGIASTGILAYVLQPLGLPVSIGVILLTTITPMIDPFLTLLNVYGNCTWAVLMSSGGEQGVAKTQAPAIQQKEQAAVS